MEGLRRLAQGPQGAGEGRLDSRREAAADFAERYGPWALVAGASEGLGAAFAEAVARRGLNVVVVARRAEALEEVAAGLRSRHRIEVRVLACDLGAPDLPARLAALDGLEIGLVVYNAAFAPLGPFLQRPIEDLLRIVDVNIRAPLVVLRQLTPAMAARGRGGVLWMSSLAGLQGSPRIATYAASKAFALVFAEGLWHELRAHGVDVVGVAAGAVRTPGYQAAKKQDAPGTLEASAVAEAALDALGNGPRVVPGWVNRLASFVTSRLLPRRSAIGIMARATADLG